jgi:deoxyribonuclease IV
MADLSFILSSLASAAKPTTLRVRQVLDGMHGSSRAALRRLIPVADPSADIVTTRYPAALLAYYPKSDAYACLGVLAEAMLRLPVAEITLDKLYAEAKNVYMRYFGIAAPDISKVQKSKTTQPFLDVLIATRKVLDTYVHGDLGGESVVSGKNVIGHPDARTVDQIFEIKLTGELKKHWSYFLCQVFAYAALDTTVNDVHLVLPLQSTVLQFDVRSWTGRAAYKKKLEEASAKLLAPPVPVAGAGSELMNSIVNQAAGMDIASKYNIGSHMPKYPTLLETVKALPATKPSQIFVGPPQNSRCVVKDDDLAAAAACIAERRLQVYIHAPYIINLAEADLPDDWAVKLLKKNLSIGTALGCRGVVVHVGKSKDKPIPAATDIMRANMLRVLEGASTECPLLLETPAGQGTEMLRTPAEFLSFVRSFESPRLRMCLDTCHVFACGHSPVSYMEAAAETPDLLRLVHFNDSMDICGACKDRHAFIGTGKIGLDVLESVAAQALSMGVPMVIE